MENAGIKLDTGTRLAIERTYIAHERTLMAWIRTALSLISFGFGIAKFFQFLNEQKGIPPPVLGPKAVGLLMISIGIVSLVLAYIQNKQALKMLRSNCPDLPFSLAGHVAALIGILGILALIGALVR